MHATFFFAALVRVCDSATGIRWPELTQILPSEVIAPATAYTNIFASTCDPESLAAAAVEVYSTHGPRSFLIGGDVNTDCNSAANCMLEQLALQILEYHSKQTLQDSRSTGLASTDLLCGEWWCQHLNESLVDGEQIPWHYDKDEEMLALHPDSPARHPILSTVTYLTPGSPTVVFESAPRDSSGATKAWVMPGIPGDHLAFDGSLLHGVPAGLTNAQYGKGAEEVSADAAIARSRITFLVNVWPQDAPPLGVGSLPPTKNEKNPKQKKATKTKKQKQKKKEGKAMLKSHAPQKERLLAAELKVKKWRSAVSHTGDALGMPDVVAAMPAWTRGFPVEIVSDL